MGKQAWYPSRHGRELQVARSSGQGKGVISLLHFGRAVIVCMTGGHDALSPSGLKFGTAGRAGRARPDLPTVMTLSPCCPQL